jgi:soluble lytic murein transglycosylase-like protein
MGFKATKEMVRGATVVAGAMLLSVSAHAERTVSAAALQHKPLPKGGVTISNDSSRITAYSSVGDIRKALFSLRSSRTLRYNSFGSSIFDSRASLTSAIPTAIANIVTEAATRHQVDPRLLAAVAHQESRFNAAAVSPVGALGVMQLMPATAKFLGVADARDARDNIFGGAKYLRMLLDTFHGDLDLTLAAYNAGPGAVQKFGGIPPYRETQQYVATIRANYEKSLRAR